MQIRGFSATFMDLPYAYVLIVHKKTGAGSGYNSERGVGVTLSPETNESFARNKHTFGKKMGWYVM